MIDILCAQEGLRAARETYSLIRGVTVSMIKAGVKCVYSAVQQIFCMAKSQGEGYSDISYIRWLGSFFWVQNFKFQYFWGFQKNSCLLGYEDFVDIF